MYNDYGIVLVVSPLISLMYDQVASLEVRGIPAITTHDAKAESLVLQRECRLVYTTPEAVLNKWKEPLRRIHAAVGVKLIAIDEAHCVSEVRILAHVRALPGVV